MYFVYIIFNSKFDRYYVGLSSDFKDRINTHNSGSVKSTKAFVPWKLVYTEQYDTRMEARKREKYFKSSARRRWRRNNLGM